MGLPAAIKHCCVPICRKRGASAAGAGDLLRSASGSDLMA